MRHIHTSGVCQRPTSSIMGIVRVMKEEIEELILRASFGGMLGEVHVEESMFSGRRI